MEQARKHLKIHKDRYNESIEQQIKEIEDNNKRLRKEFNEKWDQKDQKMDYDRKKLDEDDCSYPQDYINELHNQCDQKVEEEKDLIINENESLDIFFGEKMTEWEKWVDVYNNRKDLSDSRPFYKILAEDFPVPDFNTNDYEHEEMMKSSWYDEWEKSVKKEINIEKKEIKINKKKEIKIEKKK